MIWKIGLFLIRRLFIAILAVFALASATFFLTRLIPGDPFAEEQTMLPETLAALRHHYGLDDPLFVQYIRYLKGIATLDLGPSLKYPSETVNQIIINGFPLSATLGLEALLLAIPLGLLLGSFAARYSRGWANVGAVSITVFGVSVPSFVLATSLQFLFAIYFPLFPVARWGSFWHTVLPATALAIGPACFIGRLLRASMLEVFSMQYIQTARMKGLPESKILCIHVWKNAILPVISYLGPVTTNVLVGSFIVERVFGIPGLGQWFVNSVINRDYPVIGGLTLLYSALLIAVHTAIDLLVALLHPSTAQTMRGEA